MESEAETMIERGEGDVFHDLVLPDADELLAKAKLMRAITTHIQERKTTQRSLARLTGIDQKSISAVLRGRINDFTSDQLIQILTKLDQDVTITIAPRPTTEKRSARITVQQAQAL